MQGEGDSKHIFGLVGRSFSKEVLNSLAVGDDARVKHLCNQGLAWLFSEYDSQTCSILITWELVRNADPPVLLLDQFCKVRNSGDGVKQAPGDSDGRWRPASALSRFSHWHCSFNVNFQKGSRLYEVSCCHLYVKSEVAE